MSSASTAASDAHITSSSSEPEFRFTALPTSAAFPNSLALSDVQGLLAKWGVGQSLCCAKFRYDVPLAPSNAAQTAQFIRDLFASPAFLASPAAQVAHLRPAPTRAGVVTKGWVRLSCSDTATGASSSGPSCLHGDAPIILTPKPAMVTSLSFLDPLVEAGLVSRDWDASRTVIAPNSSSGALAKQQKQQPQSAATPAAAAQTYLDLSQSVTGAGRLSQRFEDFIGSIRVADGLRECLFDSSSEHYALLSRQTRAELLPALLALLAAGSGLSQSDDALLPYSDIARRLYRDLVCPRRNPHTGQIEVASAVFAVTGGAVRVDEDSFALTAAACSANAAAKAEAKAKVKAEAEVAATGAAAAAKKAEADGEAESEGASLVSFVGDGDLTNDADANPDASVATKPTATASAGETKAVAPAFYAPLFPPASPVGWTGGASLPATADATAPAPALSAVPGVSVTVGTAGAGASAGDRGRPGQATVGAPGPLDACWVSVTPETKTVAYLYFKHYAVY